MSKRKIVNDIGQELSNVAKLENVNNRVDRFEILHLRSDFDIV